ncbi:unnamed protein product [Effrenium voratum]|nr:unnamed protein product [Effrenium voratum]
MHLPCRSSPPPRADLLPLLSAWTQGLSDLPVAEVLLAPFGWRGSSTGWAPVLVERRALGSEASGGFASREQGRPLKYHTKATKGGLVAETEFFGAPESDPKQSTEWVAPITSIVSVKFPGGTWLRLHFYSVPMAPGACRFIMTLYRDWGYLLQKAMDAAEWFPPLRAMVAQMDMTVPFQDMISMTGQARNMKEGCPPLSVPIQCDEMAVHFRRWWGKAFTRDVWWKGWNGKMDMEDMTESALQACFGADACGQYERDITFAANSGGSRNCRPYVDRWATTHYKRSPFESSWWSTFALVLSAGLAGAAFTALSRR